MSLFFSFELKDGGTFPVVKKLAKRAYHGLTLKLQTSVHQEINLQVEQLHLDFVV